MHLRRLHRNWVIGMVAASVAWFGARSADACSCVAGAALEWPSDGATGVPTDTWIVSSGLQELVGASEWALVLPPDDTAALPQPTTTAFDGGAADVAPPPTSAQSSEAGATHIAGLHVVSPSGQVTELVLDSQRSTTDCTFYYRFYRLTDGVLSPNTEYQLYAGSVRVSSFTTGGERRDVEAEVAAAKGVKFETLGTTESPPRVTTAYVSEVSINPAFVHYVGGQEEVTYRMYPQAGTPPVATYDFGAVPCPVVDILGMDGKPLNSRSLCEPTRCKVHPNEVGGSSCGGNYSVGVSYDEFQTLPACGTTPTAPAGTTSGGTSDSPAPSGSAETDVGVGMTSDSPGPNKNPLDNAMSRSTDSGCSVTGRSEGNGAAHWLAALGLVGVAVSRRRRMCLRQRMCRRRSA